MARTAPSGSIATMAPGVARLPALLPVWRSVVDHGVLRRLLQAEIDGGARGQHVVAAALGHALDLLERPVEEPVGAVASAAYR